MKASEWMMCGIGEKESYAHGNLAASPFMTSVPKLDVSAELIF